VTDIIQKWLVGVLTTLSVALVISALSLWQRVAAVEAWRTETMPLQMAVERAQIATTLNAVELQAVRAEMRVEELADDVRSLDERVRDLENGND
jgi:hypothetical protein